MRTVIFIVPAMNGGGAERVLSTLAGYLNNHGYCVKFILTKSNSMEYELGAGVEVESNPYGGSVLHQIKFIREKLEQNPGAVFISFFTYQSMYALLANRRFHRGIIVSERSDPSQSFRGKNRILVPVRKVLYAQASRVVFQTLGAQSYFPDAVQKKGTIIPNPIKTGLPDRHEGNRRKEVVTFARLDEDKNYPMLIRAFGKFSKTHPDYTLAIYGKGPMEGELKELVRREGLDSRVRFCGFCGNVHEKIVDAAMFALASDYEGVSNSMLESMAIGLPCVCTDCAPGGARMFIRSEETGMLVPVRDVDAMSNAMAKVADNPELAEKISKNAAKVRDELRVDVIGQKWRDIIDTCG